MNFEILAAILLVYVVCYAIFYRLGEIRDILKEINKKAGDTNGKEKKA